MAPEIKKKQTYNGKSTDIFAAGVLLFIFVQGVFPFIEAKPEDGYFGLLTNRNFDKYWEIVKANDMSTELKDLLLHIFCLEGDQRPTI